jgi:hypothetical protein
MGICMRSLLSALALVTLITFPLQTSVTFGQDSEVHTKFDAEFKGSSFVESVKLYDTTGLDHRWESKPDLLYKGRTGSWSLHIVKDLVSLEIRDAKGSLIFKSDPAKVEVNDNETDHLDVTLQGKLEDAASGGRLYHDSESASNLIQVHLQSSPR